MTKSFSQHFLDFAGDLVGIPTIVRGAMQALGDPLPMPDDSKAGIDLRGRMQWDQLLCRDYGDNSVVGATEVIEDWTCDISDVFGLAASKSDLRRFTSLEEMVRADFPSLLNDVSLEGLQRLKEHDGGKNFNTDPMRTFMVNAWDGRIYLSNDGGSRHFAAAQYVAGQLGQQIEMTGKLEVRRLNIFKIQEVKKRYRAFRISESGFSELEDAVRVFGGASGSARDISQVIRFPESPDERYSVIYTIDISTSRGQKIAAVMNEAGHIELLGHLESLCSNQHKWIRHLELINNRNTYGVEDPGFLANRYHG
ncbi:hypothetical protein QRD43_20990 [Pelomonas sp. APW6]|uniref:Uncharacterized protein n=1 Tax=Roseateles subflavus TaxID=3053353 RepID=A0ABT7LQB1_9BURK|nr:DUF6685 family protein [Pelomonas sp. APW6]MDL5034392.1 hypothetical protein [Pelomonas sp. APW6]